nr:MAG TPA: BM2 protein [Caudoviricetes sp.]
MSLTSILRRLNFVSWVIMHLNANKNHHLRVFIVVCN